MQNKTQTLRLTYASTTQTLEQLVGGTIGQMYSEYDGKMGYTIGNFNKRVAGVSRESEYIKITFTDGTDALVRQAMIVYAKEEKAEDTTVEEDEDSGEKP